LDWVTTNLGRNSKLADVAATAATDAAERGRGFNSAVESAKAAWKEAARLEVDMAAATEAATIDHDRTEPRAVIALACAIAVWPWPIVTVVLLVVGRLGLAGDILVYGSWMAIVDIGTIPCFALAAVVFGHWASTAHQALQAARRHLRNGRSHPWLLRAVGLTPTHRIGVDRVVVVPDVSLRLEVVSPALE